jgi:SAM-dependent methyltransferase
MEGQLIHNWDEIFRRDNSPPWEDSRPNPKFLSLIQSYCRPDMKVIEIGCGLGHNALALRKMGIDVLATDHSENAIRRLVEMAEKARIPIKNRILNLMEIPSDFEHFDLVFDKGCWHSFFELNVRIKYVNQICKLLKKNGIWINSSGSADNIDDPGDTNLGTYPRWKLGEIVQLVESRFEILKVQKGIYGYHGEREFCTWEIVLKKRKRQYA